MADDIEALLSPLKRTAPTRRLRAVFLCLSLSQSRAPEQAKKQTYDPKTRANTGAMGKKIPTDKGWDLAATTE